jgi:hypothetical protein
LVFAIVVHKDHINLEFAQGIELLDPDGMLEGTGKKISHVKIEILKKLIQNNLQI